MYWTSNLRKSISVLRMKSRNSTNKHKGYDCMLINQIWQKKYFWISANSVKGIFERQIWQKI